jgi:crotonobetainyl-CoA:carnitine CoA-transferase CaiB-like acyl-CoA transferase
MNTPYRCADGAWIKLVARDQSVWPRFCEAIGRADLAADPRFETPVNRFRNAEVIIGILDEVFGAEPYEHWAPRLDRTGIVWGKVAELPDLVDDPQARAIGVFATIDHPEIGEFETVAAPFTLSDSEVDVRGPAPEIGQHTAEVLAERGIDPTRIAELQRDGVIK